MGLVCDRKPHLPSAARQNNSNRKPGIGVEMVSFQIFQVVLVTKKNGGCGNIPVDNVLYCAVSVYCKAVFIAKQGLLERNCRYNCLEANWKFR